MRTITLITLALTLGCSGKTENAVTSPGADGAEGAEGEAGPPGEDGEDGAPGEDGLDCWDLNGDGEANPEEDINGDGVVDVEDCRGADGDGGSTGDHPAIVQVSSGNNFSCALYESGEASCWGQQDNGGAGQPDALLQTLAVSRFNQYISCGIDMDNDVFCWGSDYHNVYAGMPSGEFTDVVIENTVLCALDTSGSAICSAPLWDDHDDLIPTPDTTFSTLGAGHDVVCGVTTDATIECWGHATATNHVSSPPSAEYQYVDVGNSWALGLTVDGTLMTWTEKDLDSSGPWLAQVLEAPEGTFVAASAGQQHACALDGEGFAECWGANVYGEATPPLFTQYVSIDAGDRHTCGLSVDGEVHCWGQPVPSTVPEL